ncbi:peptidyl-tRNA hydrolase [Kalaharituber pfeilii]|nr:peptidyl-tRNA hydrolase [Kalaharituber pfeilii]
MPPCPQVCSIGNPAPLHNTRHSAGHIILNQLSPLLHSVPSRLAQDRMYGGLIAFDPDPDKTFTLFQCPTYMNVSGKAVSTAWKTFLRDCLNEDERRRALLVVLHDEMEKGMGQVKLKRTGSAGGHNGIESCIQSLGRKDFLRVGIGISRPASRLSADVAAYVLAKFTEREREILDDESLPKVVQMLKRISKEPYTPAK